MDEVYVLEPIITLVDGLLHGEHTVADALAHGDLASGVWKWRFSKPSPLNGED